MATVVVPTYQRPRQLGECLEALAALEPPRGGFEVVVVDDGSSQPLERVVSGALDRLDVRLVRQRNSGPAGARNRGALQARGRWLAFTDDDCRPHPDWLVELVAELERTPDALVGGRTRNALDDQPCTVASETIVAHLTEWSAEHDDVPPFAATNNLAVAAAHFTALGGFDERFPLPAGEDRAFSAEWAASGRPVVVCSDAVVDHAHELDLRGFVRQHHAYGRGARRFSEGESRAGRDAGLFKGIGFYVRLLRRAWGEGGARVLALVLLAQVATLTGFLREPRGEQAAAPGTREDLWVRVPSGGLDLTPVPSDPPRIPADLSHLDTDPREEVGR